MMKKSRLFPVTITIMILCLGVMVVNWLLLPLPDWTVRSIGLLMLADLPVLVYSRIRIIQNHQ
ncbi:hypothetical protein [Acetobacterium sp.]|jgi:hypothetical protein|uniref:hypothetical protein n=1 Tax=Acetobacterium sp. TaxID=1872094 RepID=UPI0027171D2D|nr:hypothetical protein [Acetobacterium sp.]MDO9492750.1 hypothetical protein [Acetobacterium sp.]